ncbi:MAG: hypothetical protein GTO53_13600 [Planctomycetales bacterium]|nr:hypothetical protein [Planctomycetales bacterium]NIM10126.1 hypothetical protein [Planctomycetales bacterium]NIN08368.1 hypothetical protein [Planctomycetales bacterium]NIN77496.1 hypothetical protein [Planctomycetales bacterium]NIO34668.1 hypothetical protein [Planctomycetales bacterium]
MSWFTEDPTLLLVIGTLVIASLAVALAKTGRVVMIAWALAVALIMAAGLVAERLIVTEREEVEQTIEQVRRAFLDNDADKVLTHISPNSEPLKRWAVRTLQTAHVLEARITDGPHIEVNNFTVPPSATAELIAVAKGRAHGGNNIYDQYTARFFLRLIKQGDRWLVEQANPEPPLGRR